PQLSRIVSKLEGELGVVLLDRAAKRKSGWMPVAHRLAAVYAKSSRHLGEQIQRLTQESDPQMLRMGALDGLATVAAELTSRIFQGTAVRTVELDLYDLIQLEELFLKGELDLIFTGREPGRRKYRHQKRLGFQSLEEGGSAGSTRVMSSFEFVQAKRSREEERVLISNSLFVRRHWVDTFGGKAVFPSAVRKAQSGKGREEPVLLIGQDSLLPRLWEKVAAWV
ncbi:MAG TPA: LysR family transcriptional regulator, partial [Bdellovibrionota bacterium]|nr:LysR family transcriptional regulator [Bdellovibrionota bacterium]